MSNFPYFNDETLSGFGIFYEVELRNGVEIALINQEKSYQQIGCRESKTSR